MHLETKKKWYNRYIDFLIWCEDILYWPTSKINDHRSRLDDKYGEELG